MNSSPSDHRLQIDFTWSTIMPTLALATNRLHLAKKNPTFGGPEDWFDSTSLAAANAEGLSFDFFVNWSTSEVDDRIWVKRIAISTPGEGVKGASALEVREALNPWKHEIRTTHRFAVDFGFDERWVVIPDWRDWKAGDGKVLFAEIADDGVGEVRGVDLTALRKEIHARTGELFRPQKGLTYSTSKLEAALSETQTPWPGDADLVLVDADSRSAIGVVEYKKHTVASELRPTFSDYYPGKDSRRWDRLALLAERLNAPLYCLYFSVNENEGRTILQHIVGSAKSLRAGKTHELQAPVMADPRSGAEYVFEVVKVLRQTGL